MAAKLSILLIFIGYANAQGDSTFLFSENYRNQIVQNQNDLDSLANSVALNDSIAAKEDSLEHLTGKVIRDLQNQNNKATRNLDSIRAQPASKLRDYKERLNERIKNETLANHPELRKKMERRIKGIDRYERSLDLKSQAVTGKLDRLDKDIGNFPNISERGNVANLSEASVSNEIENATESVEKIRNLEAEQVDQTIDKHAAKSLQIPSADAGGLKQFQNQLDAYQGNINKIQTKASVSAQMQKRAAKLGSDLSKNYEKEVQEAQKRMRKLKRKYEDVQSAQDVINQKQNPLKGQPLSERLVPGITLQAHPGTIIGLDLSPHISYRIFPAFSAGLGATYRIGIWRNFENDIFTDINEVYGGRLLVDYKVYKGFFAHGELEMMRYGSESHSISTDWQPGLILGISKKFSIMRRLTGNVQGLFNVLHEDTSPYKKPFFIRLNFEWKLKK